MIKLAQIWQVQSGDDLEDKIAALYELEYKYSAVRDRAFNGMEERRNNILTNLETELSTRLEEVKDIFVRVFGNWLENHALLSADTWANKRTDDFLEGDVSIEDGYRNMISEYNRYALNYGTYGRLDENDYRKLFDQILSQAKKNIRYFPSLSRVFVGGLEGYKEMLIEELNSEGYKEFGSHCGKRFRNNEHAEEWIGNLAVKDVDLDSLFYSEGIDGFIKVADGWGYATEVLVELYKKFVFPHWVKYWKDQGIAETRKNVEKVYKQLQSISSDNMGNALAVISLAINTAHQNGDMLDYISGEGYTNLSAEHFRGFLTEMTSGIQVQEWNNQLREIGVQI